MIYRKSYNHSSDILQVACFPVIHRSSYLSTSKAGICKTWYAAMGTENYESNHPNLKDKFYVSFKTVFPFLDI